MLRRDRRHSGVFSGGLLQQVSTATSAEIKDKKECQRSDQRRYGTGSLSGIIRCELTMLRQQGWWPSRIRTKPRSKHMTIKMNKDAV